MLRRLALPLSVILLLTACSPAGSPASAATGLPAARTSATATAQAPSAENHTAPAEPHTLSPGAPSPSPSFSPSPSPKPTATDTAPPAASPAPPAAPAGFLMKLPETVYGVAGREMSLYFDSVTLGGGSVPIEASGPGALAGRRWAWTPDRAGTYTLEVKAGGQSAVVKLQVAPVEANGTLPRRCVFIGDSTTERGAYTRRLLEFQKADYMKLTLLGTRGSPPNLTEGRAGWKASNYVASRSLGGISNSFYNPAKERFDFGYYMKKQKYDGANYVFISLGINDVFPYQSDAALKPAIPAVLSRLNAMIDSIHAYDKSIKIGVMVTIPPTSEATTFRRDYAGRQTLSRYRRNNFLFVSALQDRFGSRESANVFLVPVNAGFDARNCRGVHPSDAGYRQMAESVWCFIKCMEANASPAFPLPYPDS